MLNRPFNTVLARLGLVAAILATLMILAPAASAADAEYDYAEDREDAVATFSASDPDADAGDIEWSLEGVDKDIFEISDEGVLTFEEQPDFEKPKDEDEDTDSAGDQGKGDNVYKVTVVASEGKLDVVVTVTNVNEDGEVTFTQPQPQATRPLLAEFTDEDGKEDPSWQWSRGPEGGGPWTAIEGATTASRSPVAADIGSYLQATVTYTDSFGEQTVSGVTMNRVEGRTLANTAPEFPDIDPIEVDEGVDGNIGDPITATDADNDHLLYDKGEVDEDGTVGADPNDNALFDVSSGGQISLKEELDYENPGNEPGTNTPKAANNVATDDIPDGVIVYTVVVKATDPSGAPTSQAVSVYLMDVNEAPEFTDASTVDAQKTLYIIENVADVTLRTGDADNAAEPVDYVANDDDNSGAGDPDTVTYKLEGDDEEDFTIDPSTGDLGVAAALSPNYEDQSSYSITIVAMSTGTDRDTKYGKLDVTIKVVNTEDTGEVTFNAREPQIDRTVVAKLDDEDGSETGIKWQWYRGGDDGTNSVLDQDRAVTADAANACADDNLAALNNPCMIDGANSAVYDPDDDDDGHRLQVVATYKDAIDSDMERESRWYNGAGSAG